MQMHTLLHMTAKTEDRSQKSLSPQVLRSATKGLNFAQRKCRRSEDAEDRAALYLVLEICGVQENQKGEIDVCMAVMDVESQVR